MLYSLVLRANRRLARPESIVKSATSSLWHTASPAEQFSFVPQVADCDSPCVLHGTWGCCNLEIASDDMSTVPGDVSAISRFLLEQVCCCHGHDLLLPWTVLEVRLTRQVMASSVSAHQSGPDSRLHRCGGNAQQPTTQGPLRGLQCI